MIAPNNNEVITIHRGQKVQFPVEADGVSATIEQIRDIRTARYLDDFTGLSWRSPGAALAMLIFLFSLAGIPPTAGFAAKLSVFYAAIQGKYYLLAVLGILNSAVAGYYYLRVVVLMYMKEPERELPEATSSPLLWAGIAFALAGTIFLGVLPEGVLEAARESVIALLQV